VNTPSSSAPPRASHPPPRSAPYVPPPPPRPATMGRCSICQYMGPPDGPSHDARTCPLKDVQCRRTLRPSHPLYEPGQCVQAVCIHKAFCTTCGVTGHLYGTQTLNPSRFKINDKGIVVRKQNRTPLTTEDFVCTLMTDVAIANLLSNTQSQTAAKAVDAHERRVSSTRLIDNVNAGGIDLDETIRLLEHKGTKSALLSARNKDYFMNLTKGAHLGAIEASRMAAEAAESSFDEQSGGEEEGETNDGEKSAAKKDARRGGAAKLKAASAIEKARKSRTDRYALAVSMSRTRSRALRPGQPRLGKATAAGGRSSAASLGSGVDGALDLDGASSQVRDMSWPAGARVAFAAPLPSSFSPSFAATPPAKIAHMMLESMCQCPMRDVDEDMGGLVVKGAVESHVRGYTLARGTLSAAQVSELLCVAMPGAMRASTLTPMERAVADVVERAAASAATAAGINTPAQRPPAQAQGGGGA